MRVPKYVTPYLSDAQKAFLNGAASGVHKLEKGLSGDSLTDVELLGICSVADPSLLVINTMQGMKTAPAEGIPMLAGVGVDRGTLGAMLSEITTSRPITAVYRGGNVEIVVQ